MRVDLDRKILEDIVEDACKEMVARLNISKGMRKKKWWRDLSFEMDNYKKQVCEEYLTVLIKDFSESVEVKFSGVRMDDEEVRKLNEFLKKVERSNVERYRELLLERTQKLMGFLAQDLFHKVVNYCHDWMLKRIEAYIKTAIMEKVHLLTVMRGNLEATIYNFVDGEIPVDIKELFKNGIESVPSMRMSRGEVKDRVEEAVIEYLNRFRSRKSSGLEIRARCVKDWVSEAKGVPVDQETLQFYQNIEEGFGGMMAEIDLQYRDRNLDSKEEIKKKLEKEGCVIVQCDKNMGMSIFTLKTMRIADEKLMEQLGAKEVKKTKEEILESVFLEIEEFENNLDGDQKDYIDYAFKDRNVRKCRVVIPFLRSTHKVHKMSEDQIERKDLSNLKFRPVVDAKRWATRGYAGLVMGMMRKLNQEVLKRAGSVMGKMMAKNGWRFAKTMHEYRVEDEYDIMMSADIQEAYTNITAEMINEAIVMVGRHVGYEGWKLELMRKLINLVLSQNYAETSSGLYLFKMVLPMGYKLSGEALDIVAISGEMTKLYYLGDPSVEVPGMPIGELLEYPEDIIDINVDKETKMARGVKSYKRYVDDTHCQISGKKVQDIADGILAIGFMFPRGLVLSIVLNIWNSQFLDVYCWKNVWSGTLSTLMKRKFSIPFGHVKSGSGHPDKFKMQSLLSEMLRSRRISSDEEIIELSDKCVQIEFQSIGYSRRTVEEAINQARVKIEDGYSGEFVRIDQDEDCSWNYYGGSLVYNKNYCYNETVSEFISFCKPAGVSGISFVPDTRLKALAYTKKRYLKRQEEDEQEKRLRKEDL